MTVFNYSQMRGIGWGYATDALSKAPVLFNTDEVINEYVRKSRASEFTKLAKPGAILGWRAGIREGIRTHWDKTYRTPIWSETWRTLEMYEHPRRYGIELDAFKSQHSKECRIKYLILWIAEKEKYGYSDYAEESIAHNAL